MYGDGNLKQWLPVVPELFCAQAAGLGLEQSNTGSRYWTIQFISRQTPHHQSRELLHTGSMLRNKGTVHEEASSKPFLGSLAQNEEAHPPWHPQERHALQMIVGGTTLH